jgi:hypothetical protein
MIKNFLKLILFVSVFPIYSYAGLITISDPTSATSSSNYAATLPEYTIDGILPSSYLDPNNWNAGAYAGWLQVDLGDVYTIDLVELLITTGNHYNILVGDGSSWAQLNNNVQTTAPYAAPGSPAHAYQWYNVNPDNIVSGQFLRYNVVVGGGHWAHLGEIKVSGTLLNNGNGNSTTVPEPSTLAIFALGMIGLASRRFKKYS